MYFSIHNLRAPRYLMRNIIHQKNVKSALRIPTWLSHPLRTWILPISARVAQPYPENMDLCLRSQPTGTWSCKCYVQMRPKISPTSLTTCHLVTREIHLFKMVTSLIPLRATDCIYNLLSMYLCWSFLQVRLWISLHSSNSSARYDDHPGIVFWGKLCFFLKFVLPR